MSDPCLAETLEGFSGCAAGITVLHSLWSRKSDPSVACSQLASQELMQNNSRIEPADLLEGEKRLRPASGLNALEITIG